MKIVVAVLLALVFSSSSVSLAQETVKIKEATISGVTVKLGQGADIVQSRITADKFVTSGYNYGDVSKGYYTDNNTSYIITYGPPEKGTGGYVVKQIERLNKKEVSTGAPSVSTARVAQSPPKPTRGQVIEARRKFRVRVISFDATQEFGTEFPYSDYVRLKITNSSNLVLDTLTVVTKRFDSNGRMIGSSRAPSISVADLKPGQSAVVDYYPRGHLPRVNKITVEIESLISPEDEQFIKELHK